MWTSWTLWTPWTIWTIWTFCTLWTKWTLWRDGIRADIDLKRLEMAGICHGLCRVGPCSWILFNNILNIYVQTNISVEQLFSVPPIQWFVDSEKSRCYSLHGSPDLSIANTGTTLLTYLGSTKCVVTQSVTVGHTTLFLYFRGTQSVSRILYPIGTAFDKPLPWSLFFPWWFPWWL